MLIELEIFKVFVLVMVRCTGLVVSAPVLGSRNFPVLAKLGLCFFLAILVTPFVPALDEGLPSDGMGLAGFAVAELLVGLSMGFVMTMVFAAIQVGGQIMDMQTGFGVMNVFNPALETQFPIFGFFFFIVAVLVLLVTNGHHMMLKALASTFDSIPLGGPVFRPELLWEVSTWGRVMFIDGLMIAGPVAGAMLIAYASMGLLSRVIPQIHLFVVGFPITIALGLMITGLSVGVYVKTLDGMFDRMFNNVAVLIRGMS